MSRTAKSELRLRNAGTATGNRSVPGDKSISHRAALLGAMAHGTTEVTGFATSADCSSTITCLRGLGVDISAVGTAVSIRGRGLEALRSPEGELDAGNSGTTIRLLAGVLAGAPVDASITGDESLRRRPMERVAVPLREMGATVETTGGLPPVRVRGKTHLRPITFVPSTPSAQVKSAVLLAGLSARGSTRVVESVRTRDHTERLLSAFGAEVVDDGQGVGVVGGVELTGATFVVPGDFSSAAFLLALSLLLPESDLTVVGVGLNPTRTRLLDVLTDLGATIEVANVDSSGPEPFGDIRARRDAPLTYPGGLTVGGAVLAEIIDEVPILAVLATQVEGGIRFTDAADLRKKESDRISAISTNLRRMGVDVSESADGFFVPGPTPLRGAVIEPFGDHRIAMAFGCAATVASGETVIKDPDVVGVSFPDFFTHLPMQTE